MDKIIKVEEEMLLRLELQRSQAEDILLDQQRLHISVQVARIYLEKLEAAATNYEQAVTTLVISEEMDSNARTDYTSKLKKQQKLTDPVIGQLQCAINLFDKFDKAARVLACMLTKIDSIHKAMKDKIAVVLSAHKEESKLSSLAQIRTDI